MSRNFPSRSMVGRAAIVGTLIGLLTPFTSLRAAAAWPERDLTLIVPGAAGGATDVLARLAAEGLREKLGKQILILNRTGANGIIGAREAAKATPDGYTLLVTTNSTWMNKYLTKDMSYDPVEELDSVVMIADIVQVISASPSSEFKTLPQVLAAAKKAPAKVKYGTSGQGSVGHLAMTLLEKRAGVQLTHVPYRATPALNVDLMSGELQLTLSALPTQLEIINAGKVAGVAVTSLQRSPLAKNIPTVAESGFPGFTTSVWLALATPKGTPREIIDTINKAMNEYLRGPAREKFTQAGFGPVGGTVQEQVDRIKRDLETWVPIVENLGL